MKKVNLLGVSIPCLRIQETHHLLLSFFDEFGLHTIATVNPEMLVAVHRCPEFRDILKKMDLCIADGVGVSWLSLITQGVWLHRMTGNDITKVLLEYADLHKKTIFLLGSTDEVILQTLQNLKTAFPHLQIFGEGGGKLLHQEGEWKFEKDAQVVERIQEAQPDVLLVALGHKKQESWIYHHRVFFPTVKIAVGVGGVFDFLSGKAVRAPKIWQSLGMEWLWRLLHEPRRFKRIVTAVILFPTLVIYDTIRTLFVKLYR